MNTGLFGEGSLSLGFDSIDGRAGLQPRLVLKGKLISKGYGIGAVVQLSADVTAWLPIGSYSLLGTTFPRPYVLNWVKAQWVQTNPMPPDETTWDIELYLPLSSEVIEGLEERRQGKDFRLQIDSHVLMIDRGISIHPPSEEAAVHFQRHPTMDWQEDLQITQAVWGSVLERWERGVTIPLVVPLPEAHPGTERSEIVRYLRSARQKIDGADYSGSIAESRKALETLRKISPAKLPLSPKPTDRDPVQRMHAVIDSVFSLASADSHTDPVIKEYVPCRSDAVAIAACTAAMAQDLFAWLKLG